MGFRLYTKDEVLKVLKKDDVLRFFRKIDGAAAGKTLNVKNCPLHTYITHPDGLGITDVMVIVSRSYIIIGEDHYPLIVDFIPTWPYEFINRIDEKYHGPTIYDGVEVSGDQCADLLETITE